MYRVEDIRFVPIFHEKEREFLANLRMHVQDIATRHMIKYLSIQNSQMPILALVDGDPYGLDIYAVYKWGSHVSEEATTLTRLY